MAFGTSATINNNQTSNDADGVVTATIPGTAGSIVVVGFAINNGTAVSSVTDNGDAGNPWTKLHSPDPDAIATALDCSVWAKQLGTTDVGKTVTIDAGFGGVRLPVAMATFTGRSSVADIVVVRGSNTSSATTVDPGDVTIASGTGWDICEVFLTRAATAVQTTMTGVPTNHTKRAEAATNFSASPNITATITSRDNVGAGTYGTNAATFSQSVNQGVGYTLALKQGTTYKKEQFLPFF